MPNWIIYDTTNNRVKQYEESSPIDPTYPVGANEGAIKDPNLAALAGIPQKYWKHSAGSVVEMTQTEKDTVDSELAAAAIAAAKAAAKALYDAVDHLGRIIRAQGKLTVDEINILRQWITSFKTETAAATNLANFQSRVAALPNVPDRTYAQARTAIRNLVDGE